MGPRIVTAFVFFVFLLASGCGSVEIKEEGAALPGHVEAGASAVLSVESELDATSRATRYFWGIKHVYRPERTFKELFDHSAGKHTDLQILSAQEAAKGDTGQPRAQELLHAMLGQAKEREIDFLFTAEIESWHQSYILFFQWAHIDFTLSCHSVHSGEPVWIARGALRRWYTTDRQIVMDALDDIFSSR